MTHDEDDGEPAIVNETQVQAQNIVKAISSYLQALGWDAIVVSASRRVDVGDKAYAPGATATVIDRKRVAPIMEQIASVLRMQADLLEKHSVPDDQAEVGYIQDRTDYSSGLAQWPK